METGSHRLRRRRTFSDQDEDLCNGTGVAQTPANLKHGSNKMVCVRGGARIISQKVVCLLQLQVSCSPKQLLFAVY